MWAAAITDGQKASSGVGFDTYTSAGKHSGGSSMRSGGTTMATMNSNNRLKPEYSPSTPGTPKRAAVMSQKDLEFDDNDSIDRGIEAIAPVRRRA